MIPLLIRCVPGAVPGVSFMLINALLCLQYQFEDCTFCITKFSKITIWQKISRPYKLSGKAELSMAWLVLYMGKPFIIRWWSYFPWLTRAIKLSRKVVISNTNTLCQCFQDKSAISCLHPHSKSIQRFLKSSKKNLNRYKFHIKLSKQPDHRV